MKRIILLLAVLLTGFVSLQSNVVAEDDVIAKGKESVVEVRIANVISKDKLNKVVLYGTYKDDSQFAENIRIEVKELKTDKVIMTVKPKENAGYNPTILPADFTGDDLKEIFLGINSGGSGGFGYFYVYSLADAKENILFSNESWNVKYTANYQDCYKVKVSNENKSQNFIIDLSLRDSEYLASIYDKNGKLLEPKSADVSGVNTVFPYLNSAQGVFQLEVLQRITGLYNADQLGYVVNQLNYENGQFKPYFTMVGVL